MIVAKCNLVHVGNCCKTEKHSFQLGVRVQNTALIFLSLSVFKGGVDCFLIVLNEVENNGR